jgi:hypothetical protein
MTGIQLSLACLRTVQNSFWKSVDGVTKERQI